MAFSRNLGVWILMLACAPVLAQDAGASVANDPVFQAWKGISGVQSCGACHYGTVNEFATRATDFCRLDELKSWLTNDKHAIARRRVEPLRTEDILENVEDYNRGWIGKSNLLSLVICKNMGFIDQADENSKITDAGYKQFREQCLNCHGGYNGEAHELAVFGTQSPQQPGISCNYCHQIGSNSEWVDLHGVPNALEKWRPLPPEAKESAGLRNLVSFTSRTQLCNDCHVGNMQQGRFVTHEMYAAGHPPLPGVETQTFISSMPVHWRDNHELLQSLEGYEGKEPYYAANFPAASPSVAGNWSEVSWDARQVVIGAISSKIQYLQLLKDASSGPRWGDYALYDCSACHHDLKVPSTVQRHRKSSAGRPLPQQWLEPLVWSANDAFDLGLNRGQLTSQLLEPFESKPFGSPDAVKSAVDQQIKIYREALSQVRSNPMNSEQAAVLLSAILKISDNPETMLDYHSARQVVWASKAIMEELVENGQPVPQNVLQWFSAIDGSGEGKLMDTKLPSGRKETIYDKYLRTELSRRAGYDADDFLKLKPQN